MTGEISPARPGAAGRRHQGEDGGGGARRHQAGAAAGAQRKDYDDIPEEARKQLEFVWLEHVDEAVEAALEPLSRR
jgi:hypothetical protein